jgi:hypothetical protein
MKAVLGVVMSMAVLGAAPTRAQVLGSFIDGGFTGWTGTVSSYNQFPGSCCGVGSTGTMTIVGSGGNPGAALEMANSVVTNAEMFNIGLSPTAIWNPQTQGAIDSVDVVIECFPVSCVFAGQGYSIAIEQAGAIYIARGGATGCGSSWTPLSIIGKTSADFMLIAPSFAPAVPDFSGAGAPIKFGFTATNSSCLGCTSYSTLFRYDNWQVTLRGVPYPSGTADLVMLTSTTSNAPPSNSGVKQATAGSPLAVSLATGNPTFLGHPVILGANVVPQFTIPAPGPLWLAIPGLLILVDGTQPGPFGPSQVLTSWGLTFGYTIPAGLGGMSIFLQSAALGGPSGFVLSDSHEIRVN